MVRACVGVVDVSSLAKFEIAGPDALALVAAVCATPVAKLALGRGRYTVMLREDGMVMDDGTLWRLAEDRWLITSSTGGAARMLRHLTYVAEVLLGLRQVAVVDLGEHWAGLAFAGPRAAQLLAGLTGTPAPAHMGLADGTIAGVAVRVLAASYSGERAFEVHVPGDQARPVFAALVDARDRSAAGLWPRCDGPFARRKGPCGDRGRGRWTDYPADLGLGGMLRKAAGLSAGRR